MNSGEAEDWFAYKEGTAEQVQACANLRKSFIETASQVAKLVPEGPDRTYTLRELKNALQAAIGGIVAAIPR